MEETMRTNYDIQADITKSEGKGKVTKKWSPCTDDFAPDFPAYTWMEQQIILAQQPFVIKKDFPEKSAGIKATIRELKELFKPFKRNIPPS